jgi:hypothetical protein
LRPPYFRATFFVATIFLGAAFRTAFFAAAFRAAFFAGAFFTPPNPPPNFTRPNAFDFSSFVTGNASSARSSSSSVSGPIDLGMGAVASGSRCCRDL